MNYDDGAGKVKAPNDIFKNFKILRGRSFKTTTNEIIFVPINEIAHISRFIFNFTFMVFNLMLESYWLTRQPMRFERKNQPKPLKPLKSYSL